MRGGERSSGRDAPAMRAPIAAMLLVLVLSSGCGQTSKAPGAGVKRRSSNAAAVASTKGFPVREELAAPESTSGDSDGDSPERTAFDGDDFHSLHFGHAADPAEWQTIATVVKRYYQALAHEDGATVCSLLLEVVAETLPEDENGQIPSSARASTCSRAVSGALAESHRALVAEARTLRVSSVRVRRRRASAILRFEERSARHILLYEENGRWKIGTLIDEDLG